MDVKKQSDEKKDKHGSIGCDDKRYSYKIGNEINDEEKDKAVPSAVGKIFSQKIENKAQNPEKS